MKTNEGLEQMKRIRFASIAFMVLGFIGCQTTLITPDVTPPSAPQGVYTETGDALVELFWRANPEPDVAGYKVYISSSYSGKYTFLGSARQPHFVDAGAQNGVTYYYAVSAYDVSGNESALSIDVAYDTPRPEGYNVQLADYRTHPASAGYDFSTYSVGQYDDQYTDVFFDNDNGAYYLDVWTDSDVRDMGATTSLYDVPYAPSGGWSTTKDAVAIPGHTYVVRTWDNHFGKLRVIAVSGAGVKFDWTYQLQQGNPRLKTAVSKRLPLAFGAGFASRRAPSY